MVAVADARRFWDTVRVLIRLIGSLREIVPDAVPLLSQIQAGSLCADTEAPDA